MNILLKNNCFIPPAVKRKKQNMRGRKAINTMKVILNQDIKGQGKKGQLVDVSDGYARNFLLPKKLAKEATKENINIMHGKQESLEYQQKKELEEAQKIEKQLEEITLNLNAKAGENGKLFGSITSKDISEALISQYHIKIDKKKFLLPDGGIKMLGITTVEIKLPQSISGKLKVNVIGI